MSEDLKEFLENEFIPKKTLEYIKNVTRKELFEAKSLYQIGNFEDEALGLKISLLESKLELIDDLLKGEVR